MIQTRRLQHEFVRFIPDTLAQDKLYISLEYATASHKCCCGCGREVVTPFSPKDWKMIFDGESISLSPSIGNWKFPCQSHYFIRRGRVIESPNWDDAVEIDHSGQTRKDRTRDEHEPSIFVRLWRRLFFK